MKAFLNAWRTVAVAAMACMVLAGCAEEDATVDDTFDAEAVQELREQKDAAFRSDDSPIPPARRDMFAGLKYFPITEDYCVDAAVRWSSVPDTLIIEASQAGDERKAIRVARFVFELQGKQCELAGYRFVSDKADDGTVFVPFKDRTNGFATYEAGRYLDIDVAPGTETATLDFNRAYHPLCAYNHDYSCPLIPRENILKVKIESGERL